MNSNKVELALEGFDVEGGETFIAAGFHDSFQTNGFPVPYGFRFQGLFHR
jgi:hypothetical protein